MKCIPSKYICCLLLSLSLSYFTCENRNKADAGPPSERDGIKKDTSEKVAAYRKSLCFHKRVLFDLITEGYTHKQIEEHGKALAHKQYSFEKEKKDAWETAVLIDMNRVEIKGLGQVMAHEVSKKDEVLATMNFGDDRLFGYFDSLMLAQDEMQIAEMPHLGMIVHEKSIDNPTGTAFVATNVPRYADINTKGIYGNAFGQILESNLKATLQEKITLRRPFTKHNILSLAAPNHINVKKEYTKEQLKEFFLAAYCGYRALKNEFPGKNIVLETGNWGAGAFGNDLRASALVQILAAMAADIRLRVYPHNSKEPWDKVTQLIKSKWPGNHTPKSVLEACLEHYKNQKAPLKTNSGNGT